MTVPHRMASLAAPGAIGQITPLRLCAETLQNFRPEFLQCESLHMYSRFTKSVALRLDF